MNSAVRLTHDEVISVTGDLKDSRIAAIVETGATLAELVEAWTWLTEEDYLGADLERPLAGAVVQVYEILKADEENSDEER